MTRRHVFSSTLAMTATVLFAAEPTHDLSRLSTWQLIRMGGWLMVPIALCSLLAVAFAAERLINLRASVVAPPDLVRDLENRLAGGDLNGAHELCRKRDCALSRILDAGLEAYPQGWERAEKSIEETGAREIAAMRQNVRPLKIISELAPLLGLLGTIQGMMGAFQKVSTLGVGRKTELFAGDIFLALVTTAAGLTVAIPSLFFYYYLAGRIEGHVLAIDRLSAQLLRRLRETETAAASTRP
jgi:biopolymer transport protein ExbB